MAATTNGNASRMDGTTDALRIEDFLRTMNTQKSLGINPQLSASILALSNNLTYRKVNLSEVPAEKAQHLLAECFVKKGDLEKSAGMVAEDFCPVIRNAWQSHLKYSFVLLDLKDEIVAVATIADAVDLANLNSDGCHPHVKEVFSYLGHLDELVQDHIPQNPQPGEVLSVHLLGTAQTNSRTENIYLMYLMEEEIHKRAAENKFKLCVAQNTNALTQQLSQFFGCKRVLSDHPTGYVNQRGETPFAAVPEWKVVTVDVKEY
ncbi:hypothetical protein BV898_09213 [Hypsibius exemplaris]|uniref:N-acetyltransferase domain-containing protein n=1 Tax=Hypsibius exemplaris TaxID=2072580 RepID=A0A1W0WNF4_HYPEX|nr:hypothetical protein BV898_09213 [Hypsibius exemplaris]